MAFNLRFWKKTEEPQSIQQITQPNDVGCSCGSGKSYEACHGLEFALPDRQWPDPD